MAPLPPENSLLLQTAVSRKAEMNSTVAEEGVSPEGLLRSYARDGRRMTTAHKRVLGAGCVQSIPQNTITRLQDPPAHHPLQWV